MSSSSPSSSSTPSRSRKRTAKAMELDSNESWTPKIRIINFDPSRKPSEKPSKTTEISPTTDAFPNPDPSLLESADQQPHRSDFPSTPSQDMSPAAVAPASSSISHEKAPTPRNPSFTPQVLMFNDAPIIPSDPLYPLLTCAKFCENCHTSETSYWRTDDNGKDHCNPCGLHWTKHHTPRPIDHNHEPAPGRLVNLACQICPTRKHARRRDEYRGIILCNACTDYWKRNNAVRPLIAFAKRPKGDRAKEVGMVRQTKKCANCGTGRSSRWMTGPDGEDNCSECGLFWMYHKMRRPLGVGVGVDVIGPKREARGPRIMESRKRRLGSVNTGSGSDTEGDRHQFDENMEMDVDNLERKRTDEDQDEMDLQTPEPPDDSPVSLLNIAILARKVQLHFQELSFLNSPLLRRPAISSLPSTIDPLITELSSLPCNGLSEFTRSALSKGVLQNLLAHVKAAEAETSTSETERRRVVLTDTNFGPESAGDNFCTDVLGNETIVAVKGLIDLHQTPSIGDFSSELEERFPGLQECRDKIAALIENEADSNVSHDSNSLPDDEFDVIDILLSDTESTPRLRLSGYYSPRTKEEIKAISQEYNYPVHFEIDTPVLNAIPANDPSVTLYVNKSTEIMHLLEQYSVESYYVSLYSSNLGATILVGGNVNRSMKDKILDLLTDTPFHTFFSQPIELDESHKLKPLILLPSDSALETLQPGCSVSLKNKMSTGTFGCVLTDGLEDVGVTVGHCVYPLDECSSRDLARGIFTSTTEHVVIHPSNAVTKLGAIPSDDQMGDAMETRQDVSAETPAEKETTNSTNIGVTKMTVRGLAKDTDQQPCMLDYSIFSLLDNGRHDNTITSTSEMNEFRFSPSGEIAPLRPGHRAIKAGRASGVTRGTVNHIKSTVKIAGFPMATWEWIVIGENGLPWAKEGDEGSSVWDEDGNLLGVLWGVIPTEGSGLVTPISEVLGSLAHFTGKYYRVKIPKEGILKSQNPVFPQVMMMDDVQQHDEKAVKLGLMDDEPNQVKQSPKEDDTSGIVNNIQG